MRFADKWAERGTHEPMITATTTPGPPVGWLPGDERLLEQARAFLRSDDGRSMLEFAGDVADTVRQPIEDVFAPVFPHAPSLVGVGIALGVLEHSAGQLRDGKTWGRTAMALRLGVLVLGGRVEKLLHDGKEPFGDLHREECGDPTKLAVALCLTSGYSEFRKTQASGQQK